MSLFSRRRPDETLAGNAPGKGRLPISGAPGIARSRPETEDSGTMLVLQATQAPKIGEKELAEAIATLTDYKSGKANLERRIVENEEWYKMRHWEMLRKQRTEQEKKAPRPEPSSAYLFNAIMNKHADAMDNYPEPNVLPREESDDADAKMLSAILPVVLERNGFERTYSDNWWEKLKHGTAPYGVFWNKELENGLGDIDIRAIDLLNIFWEPGITDIQKSRNLFIVSLQDQDLLTDEYPQLKGRLGGNVIDVKQYVYDDTVDTSEKSLVVDWYYKVRAANGRTLLHFAKFVGHTLLFASENQPEYTERGWYDHGKYPVVFDTLFPEKGTPVGFGFVAVAKDPQLYIDKLGQNIMEHSLMASKKRYFVGSNTGVNEEEFLDWNKPIVHVEGSSLDDLHIKEIAHSSMDSTYINVMQLKIDEMKETSANRDFNAGSTGSGVTAASAISALQEAGNKVSRDSISTAYRCYTEMGYLCIDLIRQFYDEARSFRITGDKAGNYKFVSYSNAGLLDQTLPTTYSGEAPMFRRPVFDITIKAQKKNPFSRASQNELAKELYGEGFFNPERAQEAVGALQLMEFEGKDKVMEYVQQGQTLINVCRQMAQRIDQMAAIIQATTGMDMGLGTDESGAGSGGAGQKTKASGDMNRQAANAQQGTKTDYQTRLAARSRPNMNSSGNGLKTAVGG